jgi:hypothetical protein
VVAKDVELFNGRFLLKHGVKESGINLSQRRSTSLPPFNLELQRIEPLSN